MQHQPNGPTAALSALAEGATTLDAVAARLAPRPRDIAAEALRSLVRRGLATRTETGVAITEAGREWVVSGRAVKKGQGQRNAARPARGLRARAWWVLCKEGRASLAGLLTTLASPEARAAYQNLREYLCALEGAGYLQRQPGLLAWKLIRRSGREAPTWRRARREMYDHNEGRSYPIAPVGRQKREAGHA